MQEMRGCGESGGMSYNNTNTKNNKVACEKEIQK